MRTLFVHQNFPGQYKHLAPILAAQPGNEVLSLSLGPTNRLPGVRNVVYKIARGTARDVHPWAADTETKVIRGEAAARAAVQLRDKHDFAPDLICAHPGWGEALFLKDVWPKARLLSLFEFYYQPHGFDAGFDPEFPEPEFNAWRTRAKNAVNLMSLENADWGVCPTQFQKSTHPAMFRDRLSVVHDGVDTDAIVPRTDLAARLSSGLELRSGMEVITFVNRNLEPYRGYHVFMRALPRLLRERPNAHVVIVGGDQTSYGAKPVDGVSFKVRFLKEVADRLDMNRVHFLGNVPYTTFVPLLQISSLHVYLTYPFVLSWSMLEAMSAGALVLGSRTAPVQEVIEHGRNGLLVDFFDIEGITDAMVDGLARQAEYKPLREAARRTVVQRYDLRRVCLPRQLALIEAVSQGRKPDLEHLSRADRRRLLETSRGAAPQQPARAAASSQPLPQPAPQA